MAREFNFSANREQSKTSLDSAEVQPKIEGRAFKDSGIEWIDQIPKEWDLVRSKRLFSHKKQIVGEHVNEFERLALTMQGVVKREKEDNEGLQPEKFDGYQVLRTNELVFKLIDLANAKTSRVGLSPFTGIVSPAYIILRNTNPDNRFFYYWFLFMYYQLIFNQMGDDGVRSSLNADDVLNIPIPNISLSEQQKIADYLDKVCGEVDEMVALQETMIEELKAYKQSVITEAVTKGLNPNVSMRESGIDWIGEIPEGWKLGRIKNLCSIISKGATPPTIDNEAYNGSVRFIKCENISGNKLVNNALYYISSESNNSMKRSQLKENDILFVIAGATIGKTAIVTQDFLPSNTNQAVSFLRLQNKQYTNYLWYILQSQVIQKPLWLNAVQSAQPNLSMEDLGNFDMPIPDESEQRAIASYLDTKCSEIDSLIALKQAKIEELKEYKKSVIYEYVTGKKEVI